MSILAAETVLFYGAVSPSLWLHLVSLSVCLAVPLRYESTHSLLGPLALLPVFRLVDLGMPTFFELTLLSVPLTYLPLLPAIYLVARGEVRIDTNPLAALAGLVPVVMLAATLGLGAYLLVQPRSLIAGPSVGWLVAITTIMIGTAGLVEELLFRGVLQRRFGEYLGGVGGIGLASVLFGAMHSVYGSGLLVLYGIGLGLVFGIVYEWTDSIGLVSVLHGVVNVFLFALFPIYSPSLIY